MSDCWGISEVRVLCLRTEFDPTRTPLLMKSADADERAPNSRKNGADKNINWAVAKRTAVSAHLNAQATDLMMPGGVK